MKIDAVLYVGMVDLSGKQRQKKLLLCVRVDERKGGFMVVGRGSFIMEEEVVVDLREGLAPFRGGTSAVLRTVEGGGSFPIRKSTIIIINMKNIRSELNRYLST
jgi:hypothetical protein